jgi:large-conductance mechanosensitive channel
MVMMGSTEILLVFVAIIFVLIPVAIIAFIVYLIVNGRNKHVKELESRAEQLEKEKAMDQRINSLEKRMNDLQNK